MLCQDDYVLISSIIFEFEDVIEVDIFNKVNKLIKFIVIFFLFCNDLCVVCDVFKSFCVCLESKKVSQFVILFFLNEYVCN